jgi:hypothetical protein
MMLSAFSLKDEVEDEDITSNLQFESKSKIMSSAKTSNNEYGLEKSNVNVKNTLIENRRMSKISEEGIKHTEDVKNINYEIVEKNKNEGRVNGKKKLFDRIDKLNKSNDEDNNIHAIKANENEKGKKIIFIFILIYF